MQVTQYRIIPICTCLFNIHCLKLACVFVCALIFMPGCATDIPVMPNEVSDHTFQLPVQRGTPKLWQQVISQANADGKPQVHIINSGNEALLARINLIRSAQKSIRIQTFMWGNDECGPVCHMGADPGRETARRGGTSACRSDVL